jgi:small multidrug resistance pump
MYAALLLLSAIGLEVGATASLPRTRGFHDPMWSLAVVAGYGLSIWLLSVVVKSVPVSIAYAVWAGVGTATVAVIGFLWLGESMNWAKAASLGLIVVGVVGLNLSGGAHA